MQRIAGFFVALYQRFLPNPWLLAIGLTLVVLLMGIGLTGSSVLDMVEYWGGGFWELLEFSMQMVLILVTGYVLASTPAVRRVLRGIAGLARGAPSAIIITTFFAGVASWLNWGFGLIFGALLATEMARQVRDVDYRLIIASAYSGFLVWHAGLSGSIPLVIATPDHFLQEQMGVIPTTQTIFAPFNLIIAAALLLVLPLVNRTMLPPPEERFVVDPKLLEEGEEDSETEEEEEEEKPEAEREEAGTSTPAEWLERAPWLSLVVGAGGIVYLISHFVGGGGLDLNTVIFIFLIAGVILHFRPINYVNAFGEAVGTSSGIILQFPFYAGIMGMMSQSGLIDIIASWFVSISTEATLPFWAFVSGGIVNFFVPSGGGQWAVQGPVMIEATNQIGADLSHVAMGVAWGDAWTNMIQPFWLLPALGIAGLKAREVMGFCAMALIVSGVIITLGLLFLT